MDLVSGRRLTEEDVATAHFLIDQHQPMQPARGGPYCPNALHLYPPAWPCSRVIWAELVLVAEDQGRVAGARSNVRRLPA